MILNVILVDTHCTRIGLIHLNEHIPAKKRVVQVQLTDEQMAALVPKHVGMDRGVNQYEEIWECFLTETGVR